MIPATKCTAWADITDDVNITPVFDMSVDDHLEIIEWHDDEVLESDISAEVVKVGGGPSGIASYQERRDSTSVGEAGDSVEVGSQDLNHDRLVATLRQRHPSWDPGTLLSTVELYGEQVIRELLRKRGLSFRKLAESGFEQSSAASTESSSASGVSCKKKKQRKRRRRRRRRRRRKHTRKGAGEIVALIVEPHCETGVT